MITYALDYLSDTPLYEQLYKFIRDDIRKSELKPGEKLPSKRTLAANLGISLITVTTALEQLAIEGYIEAVERHGYFVTDVVPLVSEVTEYKKQTEMKIPYRFDLTSNQIPEIIFPSSKWSHLYRNVLSVNSDEYLKRCPTKGDLSLRKAISDHLRTFSLIDADPEQIVISSGSDNIYNQLIQLFGPGYVYGVEDPGYSSFSKCLELYGIPYVLHPVDDSGCTVTDDSGSDIIHVSPAHQFPTGITMKIGRRYELLKHIENIKGWIIEDDYDSEFRLKGRPIPSLYSICGSNRVIYMNTFSKTISPSIKISYFVLPKELLDLYEKRLGFYSCPVSVIDQLVLARFISDGSFIRHIAKLRNHYRKVRDSLVDALRSKLGAHITVFEEDSGLHFLASFDDEVVIDDSIRVRKVSDFSHVSDDSRYIINFSGLKIEDISELVKLIRLK